MLTPKLSLRNAALIAGIAYLMMSTTPFAEFYAYPKLVISGKPAETIKNMLANMPLFRHCILSYLVNFLGDILAAWALYVLLKPVNESLSLLTAWMRLIYTAISLAALLNFVAVFRLLNSDYASVYTNEQLNSHVEYSLMAFRNGWAFAYIFFGLYLILLGYLIFKSGYIPKIVGIVVAIAGIGWLIDNIRPYLFPGLQINFTIIAITGFGELILMFWLLIMGWRIKEQNIGS